MRGLALSLIRLYQVSVAPYMWTMCRYHPTCSHYTYQAITRHGIVKGISLGIQRLGRCRPFGPRRTASYQDGRLCGKALLRRGRAAAYKPGRAGYPHPRARRREQYRGQRPGPRSPREPPPPGSGARWPRGRGHRDAAPLAPRRL